MTVNAYTYYQNRVNLRAAAEKIASVPPPPAPSRLELWLAQLPGMGVAVSVLSLGLVSGLSLAAADARPLLLLLGGLAVTWTPWFALRRSLPLRLPRLGRAA